MLEEPGKSGLLPWEKLIFKAIDVAFEMQPAVRRHLDYLPPRAPAFVVLTSKESCPAPRRNRLSPAVRGISSRRPEWGSAPRGEAPNPVARVPRPGRDVEMSPGRWDTLADTVPPHLMEGWDLGCFFPSCTQVRFVGLQLPSPVLRGPQLSYGVALGGPTGYRGPTSAGRAHCVCFSAGSRHAAVQPCFSQLRSASAEGIRGVWQAHHVWK